MFARWGGVEPLHGEPYEETGCYGGGGEGKHTCFLKEGKNTKNGEGKEEKRLPPYYSRALG